MGVPLTLVHPFIATIDLVRRDVTLSCWLDNGAERLARIAKAAKRRVPVHPYLGTGMNREGMPLARALPWLEAISRQPNVRIDGIYQMFVYDVAFDREPLARFTVILDRPAAATSVALLPVGKTDGYASTAAGACEVLIGDRPVVSGGVNSAHARAPGIGPRQS